MDTSEKYVKMCEKAQEIQELRKQYYCFGDWYYLLPFGKHGETIRICSILKIGELRRINCIWLPRQDQLVEIAGGMKYILEKLFSPMLNDHAGYYRKFGWDNFEQLLLAFIMKDKYKKVWNRVDKKWINE